MINVEEMVDKVLERCRVRNKGPVYPPKLHIITVGHDPASESYVKGKIKDCHKVGVPVRQHKFEDDVWPEDVIRLINSIEYDALCSPGYNGIIIQRPLPEQFTKDIMHRIDTQVVPIDMDVDGFNSESRFPPCTPEGIMNIIYSTLGDITGRSALVIGRGDLVGKPIIPMLLNADASVTVVHSKTPRDVLLRYMAESDIIISAIGKPEYFKKVDLDDILKPDVLLIDCGVNRNSAGELCGDFEKDIRERQTPVPKGVGLMTRAMLMKHMSFPKDY